MSLDGFDLAKLFCEMESKHNLKLAWTRGEMGVDWDDEDAVMFNILFKRELNKILKKKSKEPATAK